MTDFYNEPEFKVVITRSSDVISTSEESTYQSGQFETEDFPLGF